MPPQGLRRKLAAILSADVREYSRLMREDETATIRTLTEYRDLMATLVKQHHGRVVDAVGDNVLAEFASVVDAVQGAIAIQKEIKSRNKALPKNRRMLFRIGINLGDIVVEGGRIYGDGLNIAARLESMAEPGGICISKTAYDQIEDKLPLGYEYLGEKAVKDADKPVRAYKVVFEVGERASHLLRSATGRKFGSKHRERKADGEVDKKRKHRRSSYSSSFQRHFWIYKGVITFLLVVNILTWHGTLWVHWPALGWGLFVFLHWTKYKGRRAD